MGTGLRGEKTRKQSVESVNDAENVRGVYRKLPLKAVVNAVRAAVVAAVYVWELAIERR
jgi:hypothetical protein